MYTFDDQKNGLTYSDKMATISDASVIETVKKAGQIYLPIRQLMVNGTLHYECEAGCTKQWYRQTAGASIRRAQC